MNNNSFTYKIKFEFNESEYKNSLKTLKKEIDGTLKDNKLNLDYKDFQAGLTSARQLESLLKSIKGTKGPSLSVFIRELDRSNTSIKEMARNLTKVGMTDSLGVLTNQIQRLTNASGHFANKFSEVRRVLLQTAKFQVSNSIINAFTSQLSNAITYVEDLNKSLTGISVASGITGSNLKGLGQQFQSLAREVGMSAKQVADASLIFFQQGLDQQQALERAQISLKAAQVAGVDVAVMSEQLTAAWNLFNVPDSELERTTSVLAKLGAETATSFEKMTTAFQLAAPVASQVGLDFNELSAIIATVTDQSQQSAETVGSAFRTIFARMSGVKVEGEEEISQSRVAELITTATGINTIDKETNSLRDMSDVIREIGENWADMTPAMQNAAANAMGGTQRMSQVITLFDSWELQEKLLKSAVEETGETFTEQFERLKKESIEFSKTNMIESWQQNLNTLFDEKGLKSIYDILTKLGDEVGNIISGLGGLPGILTLISSLLAKNIGKTITNIGGSIRGIVGSTKMGATFLAGTSTRRDFESKESYTARQNDVRNRFITEIETPVLTDEQQKLLRTSYKEAKADAIKQAREKAKRSAGIIVDSITELQDGILAGQQDQWEKQLALNKKRGGEQVTFEQLLNAPQKERESSLLPSTMAETPQAINARLQLDEIQNKLIETEKTKLDLSEAIKKHEEDMEVRTEKLEQLREARVKVEQAKLDASDKTADTREGLLMLQNQIDSFEQKYPGNPTSHWPVNPDERKGFAHEFTAYQSAQKMLPDVKKEDDQAEELWRKQAEKLYLIETEIKEQEYFVKNSAKLAKSEKKQLQNTEILLANQKAEKDSIVSMRLSTTMTELEAEAGSEAAGFSTNLNVKGANTIQGIQKRQKDMTDSDLESSNSEIETIQDQLKANTQLTKAYATQNKEVQLLTNKLGDKGKVLQKGVIALVGATKAEVQNIDKVKSSKQLMEEYGFTLENLQDEEKQLTNQIKNSTLSDEQKAQKVKQVEEAYKLLTVGLQENGEEEYTITEYFKQQAVSAEILVPAVQGVAQVFGITETEAELLVAELFKLSSASEQVAVSSKSISSGLDQTDKNLNKIKFEDALGKGVEKMIQLNAVGTQTGAIIKDLASGDASFSSVFGGISSLAASAIPAFSGLFTTITTGFTAGAGAAATFQAALGVIGLAAMALQIIFSIFDAVAKAKQKAIDASVEAAEEAKLEAESLDDLISGYNELKNSIDGMTEAERKAAEGDYLEQIKKQLLEAGFAAEELNGTLEQVQFKLYQTKAVKLDEAGEKLVEAKNELHDTGLISGSWTRNLAVTEDNIGALQEAGILHSSDTVEFTNTNTDDFAYSVEEAVASGKISISKLRELFGKQIEVFIDDLEKLRLGGEEIKANELAQQEVDAAISVITGNIANDISTNKFDRNMIMTSEDPLVKEFKQFLLDFEAGLKRDDYGTSELTPEMVSEIQEIGEKLRDTNAAGLSGKINDVVLDGFKRIAEYQEIDFDKTSFDDVNLAADTLGLTGEKKEEFLEATKQQRQVMVAQVTNEVYDSILTGLKADLVSEDNINNPTALAAIRGQIKSIEQTKLESQTELYNEARGEIDNLISNTQDLYGMFEEGESSELDFLQKLIEIKQQAIAIGADTNGINKLITGLTNGTIKAGDLKDQMSGTADEIARAAAFAVALFDPKFQQIQKDLEETATIITTIDLSGNATTRKVYAAKPLQAQEDYLDWLVQTFLKDATTPTTDGDTKSKPKEVQDLVKKYGELTDQLDLLQSAYDRIGKAAEKAMGDQRNALIQQQIGIQKLRQQLQHTQAEFARQEYLNSVSTLRSMGGDNLATSEMSTEVKAGFAQLGIEAIQFTADSINTIYKSIATGNEEAGEKFKEAYDTMNDSIDQIISAQAAYMDFQADIHTKELELLASKSNNYKKYMAVQQSYLNTTRKMYERNLSYFADYQDDVLRLLFTERRLTVDDLGFLQDEAEILLNKTDRNAEDLERLSVISQNIGQNIQSIYDMDATIKASYIETLDKLADAEDKINKKLADSVSYLQTYADIYTIIARQNREFAAVIGLQSTAFGVQKVQLTALVAEYNHLAQERSKVAEILTQQTDAVERANWQKNLDELDSRLNEMYGTMLDEYKSTLEQAATLYELSVENTMRTLENTLSFGAGTFEVFDIMYEKQKELDEFYLSSNDAFYETITLADEMRNILDEGNISAKYSKQLQDLIAEAEERQLGIENKQLKVTQFDVDLLRARFDLAQRIADFEDARERKTSMKMMRDTSGNYTYVYAADSGAIDDAEKGVNDALHNIRKIQEDENKALADAYVTNNKWIQDTIGALNEQLRNGVITREEYLQRAQEAQSKYNQMVALLELQQTNIAQTYTSIRNDLLNSEALKLEYVQYIVSLGPVTYQETSLAIEQILMGDVATHESWRHAVSQAIQSVAEDWESFEINIRQTQKIVEGVLATDGNSINNLMRSTTSEAQQMIGVLGQTMTYFNGVLGTVRSEIQLWGNQMSGIFNKVIADAMRTMEAISQLTKVDYDVGTGLESETKVDWSREYYNAYQKGDVAKMEEALLHRSQIAGVGTDYASNDILKTLVESGRLTLNNSGTLVSKKTGMSLTDYWTALNTMGLAEFAKVENSFDTGGYVKGNQIAQLHDKELVLNKQDTENLLKAVNALSPDQFFGKTATVKLQLSELVSCIKTTVEAMSTNIKSQAPLTSILSDISSAFKEKKEKKIKQEVNITASFPNVSVRSEIESAFTNLQSLAMQQLSTRKG